MTGAARPIDERAATHLFGWRHVTRMAKPMHLDARVLTVALDRARQRLDEMRANARTVVQRAQRTL